MALSVRFPGHLMQLQSDHEQWRVGIADWVRMSQCHRLYAAATVQIQALNDSVSDHIDHVESLAAGSAALLTYSMMTYCQAHWYPCFRDTDALHRCLNSHIQRPGRGRNVAIVEADYQKAHKVFAK